MGSISSAFPKEDFYMGTGENFRYFFREFLSPTGEAGDEGREGAVGRPTAAERRHEMSPRGTDFAKNQPI